MHESVSNNNYHLSLKEIGVLHTKTDPGPVRREYLLIDRLGRSSPKQYQYQAALMSTDFERDTILARSSTTKETTSCMSVSRVNLEILEL